MKFFNKHIALLGAALLARLGECAALGKGGDLGRRAVVGSNSADDRSVWADGFDLSTDYYDNVPNTGVTREV